MKKTIVFICIAIIISMLIVPASASTANSSNITRSINGESYTPSNLRTKDDTSATYLYISSAAFVHTYVQACACDSAGVVLWNETWVQGNYVSDVVCRRYIQYSIHNNIYEDGYRYERLQFMNLIDASSSITFTWSPDSSGTYIYAT